MVICFEAYFPFDIVFKPDKPSASVVSLFTTQRSISAAAKNLTAVLKFDDIKLMTQATMYVPGPVVVHSIDTTVTQWHEFLDDEDQLTDRVRLGTLGEYSAVPEELRYFSQFKGWFDDFFNFSK